MLGILEAFYFYCHHFLVDPGPDPQNQDLAKVFLAGRGFDPARLDELPAGLFVQRAVMEACLQKAGFTPADIRRSGLTSDPRLAGRLVGPVRDRHGRIVSFWARHPHNDDGKYLLLHKEWPQQVPAIGLDMALTPAAGGENHLILVEGLLDMLLLHCRGILHVAAIGGPAREFGPARWEQLAALGVRRVTLLLDGHPASQQRMAAALEHCFRAKAAPTVYVVLPAQLGATSGPGELVRVGGAEQFLWLVERERVHAYHCKALALLAQHKTESGWSPASREHALEAAVDFYLVHARQHRRDLNTFFLPPILESLLPEPPRVALWEEAAAVADHPAGVTAADPQETPAIPRPAPPAAARPRRPDGYCALHRCESTECFCFD